MKRRSGVVVRKTGGKSQLLEDCVRALTLINFVVFEGSRDFLQATGTERYVIRNYPHESLYGTPGKKEAFIFAPCFSTQLVTDEHGNASCVIECKYQDISGSVDEKLPYVYSAFVVSPIANWIVIFEGKYWKTARGKAAVSWLESQSRPPDKRLIVTNRKQFHLFAKSTWKPQ